MKKLILTFLIILSTLFITLNNNVNAVNNMSSDLEFKVTRVESNINSMRLTLEINNNTKNSYSYGWVNSSELILETDKGIYKTCLSSLRTEILPGTNTRHITVRKAQGTKINSIQITDVRLLNGDLPAHNSSITLTANVSDLTIHTILTFQNFVILATVLISSLVFYLKCIKGDIHKLTGIFLVTLTIGVTIMIIGAYYFVVKPSFGFEDAKNMTHLGWILGLIGLICTGVSASVAAKIEDSLGYSYKGNKKRKKHNYQTLNNDQFEEQNRLFQQQMFMEQNRIFEENVNRHVEESNRFQREADEQARQAFDSFNQQNEMNNFNDFNNNNNFPNF